MKKTSILLIIIIINAWGYSQQPKKCEITSLSNYILDGHSYKLVANESLKATIHVIFFSTFEYRVQFCSTNTKNYKITLYDVEKNMIFSETCNNYHTYFDLRFKSDAACIFEIEALDKTPVSDGNPAYFFTLGFKEKIIFGR